MELIYKPFGIILGILAGLVGKRLFNFAWEKIDDEDPPKGTTEQATWVKIVGAAALQGVIFKVDARRRRSLRRERLALPHRFVAGREASGPRLSRACDCAG